MSRKLNVLPSGERPITSVAVARARFMDTFVTVDGKHSGQFMPLIKAIGAHLVLPPGDVPYVVPNVPIVGTYATGTKFKVNKASLFTATSKMPGASFAIPAGPPAYGGTCPASALGDGPGTRERLEELMNGPDAKGVHYEARRLPVVEHGFHGAAAGGLVSGVSSSYAGDESFVCRSCLTGDTLIMVRGRGLVPIEQLVGQEVEVWSGKAWRKTTAIFQGVRPVVELETNRGAVLRLTPDHKVKTAHGEMLAVETLKEGDQLAFEPAPETPFEADTRPPYVKRIDQLPNEEPVYDLLNVGEEHQFVANGITVSNCYALGGNYGYPSKQLNDAFHLAWCEHELDVGGPERLGTALAYAIQHVNMVRAEGFQPYFRIHDAGDFYSERYLEAWVVCASMMTHMKFWAPTRQWVFSKWAKLLVDAEARVRQAGGHLVIRPSVLRIGDPVPRVPGLSAGSGVSSEAVDPCVWVCPVYNLVVPKVRADGSTELSEASSCLEAQCTMCWSQPDVAVSYGAH